MTTFGASKMKTRLVKLSEWLKGKRDIFADVIFVLGALATFVLMLALGGVGLLKMFASISHFWRSAVVAAPDGHGAHSESLEMAAITLVLQGLECLFLAPLGFLLFRGIWDYVGDVIKKDAEKASACFLMRVKALILGLMAAVVATDLVKRELSEAGLTYQPAIAGCLLICVLAAYSYLVERLASGYHLKEIEDLGLKKGMRDDNT